MIYLHALNDIVANTREPAQLPDGKAFVFQYSYASIPHLCFKGLKIRDAFASGNFQYFCPHLLIAWRSAGLVGHVQAIDQNRLSVDLDKTFF